MTTSGFFRPLALAAAVSLSFTLTGCGSDSADESEIISSAGITTNQITANYGVIATTVGGQRNLEVEALFRQGNDSIQLNEGDQIALRLDGEDHPLTEIRRSGRLLYRLNETLTDGNSVNFVLTRTAQSDANSSVTIPPTFEIDGFSAGVEVPLTNGRFDLEWSGGTVSDMPDITVIFDYSCQNATQTRTGSREVEVEDDGEYEVDFLGLVGVNNGFTACTFDLTMRREASGTLDSALRNGSIEAFFEDEVKNLRVNF